MKTSSIIIFAPFAVGFIILVIKLAWHYSPLRKRRIGYEHEYNMKYKRIEQLIRECRIDHRNYVWISGLLHHLGQLPYKNHEKTEVLSVKFWTKFHEMAKIEVNEFQEMSIN